MKLTDITLIAKKIAVGVLVTVIPLMILFGALWLTQHVLIGDAHSDGAAAYAQRR
jgi:hypothetical protein